MKHLCRLIADGCPLIVPRTCVMIGQSEVMTMRRILYLVLLLLSLYHFSALQSLLACTSAVIGPDASKNRGPILWKNRDTGYLSNKIVFVNEKPYSYIGIVNEKETSGRFVYAGLNETGFGIINTVAYNLPKEPDEFKDLEGSIMADALRTCRSVADFEFYLKRNLGETLGSWANFGVIDGNGNAILFEVHNHGYRKFDSRETAEKYLINSNYARSGLDGKGQGYLRFEQASRLFQEIPGRLIDPTVILHDIARNFGHPLVSHPDRKDLSARSGKKPYWIYNRDCINRPSTSAAIVIHGKSEKGVDDVATMWVILGEPLSSIAVPLWVKSGTVPTELNHGSRAPIYAESRRIRQIYRPFNTGSKMNYMNLSKVMNREKSGILPPILKTEQIIFEKTERFLKKSHTQAEYAAFQKKMATFALRTLKSIK